MDTTTIGELADRTGLAVSAIRFYQRRGLLPPRNAGSGWQRYGPDTLVRLAVIELAKRTGFSLDETAQLLAPFDTDESPAPTWRALATEKLADIDMQIARLQHMRDLITEGLNCSCMTLDQAQLVPAALGWATEHPSHKRSSSERPRTPPDHVRSAPELRSQNLSHNNGRTIPPQLRAELDVTNPADRGPSRAWEMRPAIDAAVPQATTKPTRVGYARCGTAQQELQSQLDALNEAGCDPIFSEKISTTRIKVRPEFTKAMEFARTIKKAVPHQRVIFTVHEMTRLGRGAAELLAIAEDLRHHDIQLELLTGPLQGVYDPSRHGAALFAFFAGMAESEREYSREKSLEGQASARERGRHGGRPKVVDDNMAAHARALRAQNVPVPEIARKLVISSGKNKGEHASLATVYRILTEDKAANGTA